MHSLFKLLTQMSVIIRHLHLELNHLLELPHYIFFDLTTSLLSVFALFFLFFFLVFSFGDFLQCCHTLF